MNNNIEQETPVKEETVSEQLSDKPEETVGEQQPEVTADAAKSKTLTMQRGSFIRKIVLAFLLGIACSAAFVALYFNVFGKGNIIMGEQADYFMELEEKYGKYYDIEKIIREHTLYELREDDVDPLIASAVLQLVDDKYTQYFTQKEYEEFSRQYLDSYSGIGVAIQADEEGRIVITRIIEDSPAEEAGLLAGDVILTVDGEKPAGIDETSERIRGEQGTAVDLVIDRDGEELSFTIYRAEVTDKSVFYEPMFKEDGVGYIQIQMFRDGTADEFEAAVRNLKDAGCDKIIIDLRGNSGGVLQDAVDLADQLLPACKIITVRDHDGEEDVFNSDGSKLDIEYVLLVDGNSASASEILAGAVKDNKGGVLLGTKTYGKGVIQSLYRLRDGSVIKLTTEEYILPSGNSIDGVGIEPDIELGKDDDAIEAGRKQLLGE